MDSIEDEGFWPRQPSGAPRLAVAGGLLGPAAGAHSRAPVKETRVSQATVLGSLAHLVPAEDIAAMKQRQHKTFTNLQQSKELLATFSHSSAESYDKTSLALQKSAALLRTLRSDLDHIFRRTRALRQALKRRFPDEPVLQGSAPFTLDD